MDTKHAALTAALAATPPPALLRARASYVAALQALGLTLQGVAAFTACAEFIDPAQNATHNR